jgi:hypothetical protein
MAKSLISLTTFRSCVAFLYQNIFDLLKKQLNKTLQIFMQSRGSRDQPERTLCENGIYLAYKDPGVRRVVVEY